MPRNIPMTLADIQEQIHTLFQNGVDVPASTDEEYLLRTTLINHAIGIWEGEVGVKWQELHDVDTSNTYEYSANPVTVECQETFKRLAGKVLLISGTQKYEIPVVSKTRLDDDDLPETYCYVSGTPGSKSIVLVGVPEQYDGWTIRFRFYRYATLLEDITDIPDLSKPQFLVELVTAELFYLAKSNSGYELHYNRATEIMDAMKAENGEEEVAEEPRSISAQVHQVGTGWGS